MICIAVAFFLEVFVWEVVGKSREERRGCMEIPALHIERGRSVIYDVHDCLFSLTVMPV
jgi:hypothetical protein